MPGVAVLEPARMAQGLSAFGRLPAHLHSYRNMFNNSVTERTLLRATRSFHGNGNDKPRKSSGALVCLPGFRLGCGPYFNAFDFRLGADPIIKVVAVLATAFRIQFVR